MLTGFDFFNARYTTKKGVLTYWYPTPIEGELEEVTKLTDYAYLHLQKHFKFNELPQIDILFVAEHDWSKTPYHDEFPFGLSYLTNSNHPPAIYLSHSLPVFHLMTNKKLTRAIITWHEIAKLYFNQQALRFPPKAPVWLKEGLPQLAVWTLFQETKIDCEPMIPIETKLRDQTHFTILEYEPSMPVKPARYVKYQWLLLFMMRDLAKLHQEYNNRHLLDDVIESIKSAPRRMDYMKSMDFFSKIIRFDVGDWLSTRWYF